MPGCAPPRRSIRKVIWRGASEMRPAAKRSYVGAFWESDPLARVILEETAEDLAFGLSHVVHLFHPQIIVLGGGLALIGESLRGAVERPLRRFVMEAFAPGPKIALARLREDAVPVGALELATALGRGEQHRERCI